MKIYNKQGEYLYYYVSGNFQELAFLKSILTFRDKKKERDYQMALQSKAFYVKEPEPIHFFDEENSRFLGGLLPYVEGKLKSAGGSYTLSIKDKVPAKEVQSLYSFSYRKYQQEAIETALSKRRGLIKLATAAGKTAIAGGIIKSLDIPSLFLVTQVPLLHQAAKSFRNFGVRDIGIIGDRRKDFDVHTIADARYLSQLLKSSREAREFVKRVRVVVTDECHRSAANSWLSSILSCSFTEYVFGMSGTPFESRNEDSIRDIQIKSIFGDVIYEVTARDLLEEGYIAKPIIYMFSVNGGRLSHGAITNFRMRGRQYNKIYVDGIVNHKERNSKAVDAIYVLSQLHDLSVLVLVNHIKHGVLIIDKLKALGIPAVFLAGNKVVYYQGREEPEQDLVENFQSETVKRFASGEFKVLVGSPVLGEGYDLPGDMVEALILLSGGKGLIPVLQRLGRALRPKPGSNEVIVIDFLDHQHFYLENHSRRRSSEYIAEGYDVFGEEKFINDFMGVTAKNGQEE